MRRWTVMLVPRNGGTSHRLNVNTVHLWVLALAVAGLLAFSFSMVNRYRATVRRADDLRQTAFSLNDLYQKQLGREIGLRQYYHGNAAAVQQALDRLFKEEMKTRGLADLPNRRPADENQPTSFWRTGILNALTSGFAQAFPDDDPEEKLDGQGGGSTRLGEVLLDLLLAPTWDLPEPFDPIEETGEAVENYQGRLERITRRIDQLSRLPSLVPTSAQKWRVTSGFGVRREPFGNLIGYHHGIDVAARRGADVRATASGTVVYSKTIKTLGRAVRIDHGNGLHTLYGHLQSSSVETGDRVERGEVIGKLGSTGLSSGPHVHYEVRLHDRPINPDSFLEGLHPGELLD